MQQCLSLILINVFYWSVVGSTLYLVNDEYNVLELRMDSFNQPLSKVHKKDDAYKVDGTALLDSATMKFKCNQT